MACPDGRGRRQVVSVGRRSQIVGWRPGRDRRDPPSRKGGATSSPGPSRASAADPAEIDPRFFRERKLARVILAAAVVPDRSYRWARRGGCT